MPPRETPDQSSGQRPLQPRYRPSVDGFSTPPLRRPVADTGRPVYYTRPVVTETPPLSATPVPLAIIPQPAAQQAQAPEVLAEPAKKRRKLPKIRLSARRRRQLLKIIVLLLVIVAVIWGGYALYKWHNTQESPDTIFKDALQTSFFTTNVQRQTGSQTVSLDLVNLKNPIISATASLNFYGSNFESASYGSAQNSYISYTKFPSTIPSSVSAPVKNGWVQLRANGALPAGVNTSLNNLADPRYQAFGTLVFGNFSKSDRIKLANFLINNKVYAYSLAKVQHTTFGGTKVLAYPIILNASYLQVFNQSVASIEGFSTSDVQSIVNALSGLKGATGTLYVADKGHHFVGLSLTKNGQTTTTAYSYSNAALPDEPQTILNWDNFVPQQVQIEQQAATHQTAAQLDSDRQSTLQALHTAVATYFAANQVYPTLNELNTPSWVSTNFSQVNPDIFRDPLGSTPSFALIPAAEVYAYQPGAANPKVACDNATNPCVHFKFVATLSNGQQYVVTDP